MDYSQCQPCNIDLLVLNVLLTKDITLLPKLSQLLLTRRMTSLLVTCLSVGDSGNCASGDTQFAGVNSVRRPPSNVSPKGAMVKKAEGE